MADNCNERLRGAFPDEPVPATLSEGDPNHPSFDEIDHALREELFGGKKWHEVVFPADIDERIEVFFGLSETAKTYYFPSLLLRGLEDWTIIAAAAEMMTCRSQNGQTASMDW
jgi:hypothetical protein